MKLIEKLRGRPVVEGAGVKLYRVFGFGNTSLTDPFLLLDDFRGDNPADYTAGFPQHPHRGIETITYMLEGEVEHGDSLGNKGVIKPGGVQWMTAGSGIIHQEMPKGNKEGRMGGFQLWANLPAADKMTAPKYRDVVKKDIPVVKIKNGSISVICGEFEGIRGPVKDVFVKPEYYDVVIGGNSAFEKEFGAGLNVMAYVYAGNAKFAGEELKTKDFAVFKGKGSLSVKSGKEGVKFLLIAGIPLNETVAWYGPIVMNTESELEQAFEDYRNGTFLKHK